MSRLRAFGHQSTFEVPMAVFPPCMTGHLPVIFISTLFMSKPQFSVRSRCKRSELRCVVRELLEQVEVLYQDRAERTGGLRVLVIGDGCSRRRGHGRRLAHRHSPPSSVGNDPVIETYGVSADS